MLTSQPSSWRGSRFKRAFGRLMLPITTANDRLVADWQVENVWEPFWATVQDYFINNSDFRGILEIVMDFEKNHGSTETHRILLQDFVDRRIPGYQLLFEADILPALNHVLAHSGSNERVLGFRYGKDGRGAMPDRYYQILLRHKYLVVGNHHDVLGHFVLFCDPSIREATERLAAGFSDALEFEHRLRRDSRLEPRTHEIRTLHLRRVLRLYTLSWNLVQEKLYVQTANRSGQPVVNLIGAFNSVYNTIFSDKLGSEHVRQVAGALGFFNRDPQQGILITPTALREFCKHDNEALSETLSEAIDQYRAVWVSLGFDATEIDKLNLVEKFENIVAESLFQRRRFFQPSTRMRWVAFSDRILADRDLARIFDRGALLAFSKAMTKVAEELFRREKERLS